NFDAVEAGFQGVGGTASEAFDDAGNLVELQRTRLGDVYEFAADECLSIGADRRGRNRGAMIRLNIGMRDAPDVTELKDDVSPALMESIGHLAPAGDLFLRIDAWRVLEALPLLRNLARLANQQAGGGALAIIFDRRRTGHKSCQSAVAGQRRHCRAVFQSDRAKFVGLEEFRRVVHFFAVPELSVEDYREKEGVHCRRKR